MILRAGEKFSGKVRSLSFKGLGVVNHPNGQVFFVRGTWPGDEGVFEIEELQKNYGFAKLLELSQKSPDRRVAPCPHLGFEVSKCGGCPWMIAEYSSQLREKEKLIRQQLERSKLISNFEILKPIQGSPNEFKYRNRAQFKTDGKKIGFISTGTNVLAEIESCMILTEKNQNHFSKLRAQLPKQAWEPQDGEDWNFLEIDENMSDDDLNTLNQKRSFMQANNQQNAFMKNWLESKINSFKRENEILELFCGSGNFTEVFSKLGFQKIVAVESNATAIKGLDNKKLAGVKTQVQNIFDARTWGKLKNIANPEILFLDPPREGFEGLSKLLKIFPTVKTLIYVSCDPMTWVRDSKGVTELGFKFEEIQPLDQFPQTPHIELLSILTRK